MDDLLQDFDPLHASNSSSSSSSNAQQQAGGKASTSSSTNLVASLNGQSQIAAYNTSNYTQHVQAKAAVRQNDILSELEQAEQPVDWQSHQRQPVAGPSTSYNPVTRSPPLLSGQPANVNAPANAPRQFMPPRRMSRSGLMKDTDDFLASFRSPPASSSYQSSHPIPSSSHNILNSPTGVTNQQSDLFHPSSPPGGSTLESMRHSSYFGSIGRSGSGSHTNTRKASGPSNSHYNDASSQHPIPSTSSSSTARQAFGIPPPPAPSSFSSSANKEDTQYLTNPITTSPKPTRSESSPSWTSKIKTKVPRKLPSFDFPTSFSESNEQHNNGFNPILEKPSKSRNPSPASSLMIDAEPLPTVILKVPRAAETTRRILNEDIAEGIRPSLPSRIRLARTWSLLYSIDANGTSLSTLYTRVKAGLANATGGCVLVIHDTNGITFGAYLNEAFSISHISNVTHNKTSKDSFYGSGESFLWSTVKGSFSGDSTDFRIGPIIDIYKWSMKNDYILLSNNHFFVVGGGNDGKFGLYVDSNLDKGHSTKCQAFDNEPLSKVTNTTIDETTGREVRESKFEIVALECWAVG